MTIRFSGNFDKIQGQKKAKLLAVNFAKIDRNTPEEVLEYETLRSDGRIGRLEEGYYLQLVFVGNYGKKFSTLRKQTYEKVVFYTNNVGNEFDIEVI